MMNFCGIDDATTAGVRGSHTHSTLTWSDDTWDIEQHSQVGEEPMEGNQEGRNPRNQVKWGWIKESGKERGEMRVERDGVKCFLRDIRE